MYLGKFIELEEKGKNSFIILLQEFMKYMDLYRSVEAHLLCTDHLSVVTLVYRFYRCASGSPIVTYRPMVVTTESQLLRSLILICLLSDLLRSYI